MGKTNSPNQHPENKPVKSAKPKRKAKPRKYLTPSQWVNLRALYEFGEYTFRELSKTWDISEDAIKKHSMKEKWSKGKLESSVKKKIEENTIDMFARLGMPKEELIRLMIEGARQTNTIKNVKEPVKDKNGKQLTMKNGRPLVVERTIQVIDNESTLRYRQEINKMCGYLAPPKQAIETKPEGPDETIPMISYIDAVKVDNKPAKAPGAPEEKECPEQ